MHRREGDASSSDARCGCVPAARRLTASRRRCKWTLGLAEVRPQGDSFTSKGTGGRFLLTGTRLTERNTAPGAVLATPGPRPRAGTRPVRRRLGFSDRIRGWSAAFDDLEAITSTSRPDLRGRVGVYHMLGTICGLRRHEMTLSTVCGVLCAQAGGAVRGGGRWQRLSRTASAAYWRRACRGMRRRRHARRRRRASRKTRPAAWPRRSRARQRSARRR